MTDTQQSTSPEESFSFVDKRRINSETVESVVDDTPGDNPSEPDFLEDEIESEATDEDDDRPSPSVYDLGLYSTGLFVTEAFQKLGLFADPKTGKAVKNLPEARVAIDCVAALVGVLDSAGPAIPDNVRKELKRSLNDLRLNFVEQSRRP